MNKLQHKLLGILFDANVSDSTTVYKLTKMIMSVIDELNDDLKHTNHEMLRYIKKGIGVYNVRPPSLIEKWESMVDPDINWKCFYELRHRESMDILKELNPDIYYQLLDEMDKRKISKKQTKGEYHE